MLLSVFSIVAAATAVSAQTSALTAAPVVSSSPLGASYVARLPEGKGGVSGSITGTTGSDGKGVNFAIALSGLPAEGGPFMYHIHEFPISTDGNCTSAGAHLDPYKRGEQPPCDASEKETCQTGDLSGKYGNFTTTESSASYLDLYSSTNPEDNSFFGDLSIVVHFSNKTRITCANFTLIEGGASSSMSSGYAMPTGTMGHNGTSPTGTGSMSTGTAEPTFTSGSPTQPAEPTESAPLETNGAGRMMVAGAAVLAGAVALIL